MSSLESKIESLIFCSPKPIKIGEIIKTFSESEKLDFSEKKVLESIKKLINKFKSDDFSFEIIESGGGYQFLTKKDYSR